MWATSRCILTRAISSFAGAWLAEASNGQISQAVHVYQAVHHLSSHVVSACFTLGSHWGWSWTCRGSLSGSPATWGMRKMHPNTTTNMSKHFATTQNQMQFAWFQHASAERDRVKVNVWTFIASTCINGTLSKSFPTEPFQLGFALGSRWWSLPGHRMIHHDVDMMLTRCDMGQWVDASMSLSRPCGTCDVATILCDADLKTARLVERDGKCVCVNRTFNYRTEVEENVLLKHLKLNISMKMKLQSTSLSRSLSLIATLSIKTFTSHLPCPAP